MRPWTWATYTASILSITGVILIVFFACSSSFNGGSGIIDPNLAGQYGSFIGGLIGPLLTLAGMFLIYETIMVQRSTFQMQQF